MSAFRSTLASWFTRASGRASEPDSKRALKTALLSGTRPLINLERKLVLLISPKSACTNALIWFYHTQGLAETAEAFHRWPHRYRTEVYNHSDIFDRALEHDLSSFTWVRVVRNSYDRAVSSFRHCVATGYADAELARHLGRPSAKTGLSFNAFIQLLEKENLARCNPHHGLQRHATESIFTPRFVIDVTRQDLDTELNRVERELGLDLTDFAALQWRNRLHARRKMERREAMPNALDAMLTREQAFKGPWPETASLLTPEVCARLSRLYRSDIESYRFPDPSNS